MNDQELFNTLLNKRSKEPAFKTSKEFEKWSEDHKGDYQFTDEEIKFMAKHNFDKFSDKFPSIAEYYMLCLDN